jgi:photosystem II stability/assembly factor-like uncharacterized protein
VSVPDSTGGDAWAVGMYGWPFKGLILHESSGHWSKIHPTRSDLDDLNGLAVASSGEGWAVGENGALLHLTDAKWSAVPSSPTTNDLNGVALSASGSEGWAVGFRRTLLHLTGGAWRTVRLRSATAHTTGR